MAKKFLTHIDLSKNELQNAVIQRLSADPGSPVEGQIYYNTVTDRLRTYDGAAWYEYGNIVNGVTQSANSGGAGRMKVSGGADRTITDYAGGAGLIKTDANGVPSAATPGTDYVTGSSTNTFTNKTFDANGTGNSITNLETADFAANVIDNDAGLTANSATRLATQQAVKSYVDNMVQGLSWKQAVRVATTVAGTLATSFANGQTIDGITLVTGDRILIKNQAAPADNGIYTVNASGAPTRATDANTAAEILGATVFVSEGTANGDKVFTNTTNAPITLGTTGLTFAEINGGSIPTATTTTEGKVELATQAETEARTDTARAVTPSGLANFGLRQVFTIGDGSATSIAVTHNYGHKNAISQVFQVSNDEMVECDIVNTSNTQTTFSFVTAPASNSLRVVLIG